MSRLVIVKTGETLPELSTRRGDFDDWIARGTGWDPGEVDVIRVDRGEALPDARTLAGVVVTGSSALVTDREPWSERTAAWMAEAARAGVPLLGICYGHQLLAHGLGGRVGDNPRGREIGTVEVRRVADDPLLAGLGDRFPAHATHVQSVLALPPGARRLAESDGDPNQAFAWGACAWGVQFHPEFDADVMRGYLDGRRERILAEGLDPDALRAAVRDTPAGPRILRRFARRAAAGETERILLFDGVCSFCDGAVRWLIARDPARKLRFAPLQGETAAALRVHHPEIPREDETAVLVERRDGSERVFLRSEAVLRVVALLDSPWRHLARLRGLPRIANDLAYAVFARLRYRVFGRREACRLPMPDERERFLD